MPRKRTKATTKTKKGGKKGGASVMVKSAGILAGGAVGLAAGAILADQEKREKLVKTAGTLASRAADVVEEITDDAQSWRDRAHDSLEGPKEEAEETVKKVRKVAKKS